MIDLCLCLSQNDRIGARVTGRVGVGSLASSVEYTWKDHKGGFCWDSDLGALEPFCYKAF